MECKNGLGWVLELGREFGDRWAMTEDHDDAGGIGLLRLSGLPLSVRTNRATPWRTSTGVVRPLGERQGCFERCRAAALGESALGGWVAKTLTRSEHRMPFREAALVIFSGICGDRGPRALFQSAGTHTASRGCVAKRGAPPATSVQALGLKTKRQMRISIAFVSAPGQRHLRRTLGRARLARGRCGCSGSLGSG